MTPFDRCRERERSGQRGGERVRVSEREAYVLHFNFHFEKNLYILESGKITSNQFYCYFFLRAQDSHTSTVAI